jgi:hypothetical protein
VFTAVVPDVQYGRSIKDFLESPVAPGSYPAMVEGYFVMITFDPPHPESGGYWVHSWASAPREVRGPYFSELLYQIDVSARKGGPRGAMTEWRPARNERILSKILEQKDESGDLTELESRQLRSYFMETRLDKATGKERRVRRKPLF